MRAHQPALACLRAGHAPAGMIDLQAGDGQAVLAAAGGDDTQCLDVDRGIVRAKLEPPVTLRRTDLADGEDVALLTGIPNDAAVRIDARVVVHDGALKLTATLPGAYEIEITPSRHLTWRTTIRAA